jgi:hypothetical protein
MVVYESVRKMNSEPIMVVSGQTKQLAAYAKFARGNITKVERQVRKARLVQPLNNGGPKKGEDYTYNHEHDHHCSEPINKRNGQ